MQDIPNCSFNMNQELQHILKEESLAELTALPTFLIQ